MAELKPCPFCGGAARTRHFQKSWRVACENEHCECVAESGYHKTKAEAEEAWNRRVFDG